MCWTPRATCAGRPAPVVPSRCWRRTDNVFIRRVPWWELQRNVYVTGEVKFPRRYNLTRRDEKLLDVLNRAGGLTPDAYVGGAQFFRSQEGAGRIGIDLEQVLRDPSYRTTSSYAGDSLYVPSTSRSSRSRAASTAQWR